MTSYREPTRFDGRKTRGFTLLETLVALAIVAIALISALRAMGASTLAASELRDRVLADWVARNRLATYRASAEFPATGRFEGRVTQGHSTFRWRERVGPTPNALFRRIDVDVLDGDGHHVLAHATGYVTRAPR
ncbi:type II secretion system minor pseudopilin GspI [Azoarcus sp. L1K30]|uniref:type II secretion system minor pseudopilin GspI n=1 Tax=Azoarcus sp. L1K30 TaxID=2820277 RepID=UPI001B83B2EB|nr:type II secretion system minor pseudopilin GspI [Azoarcus sp. L1K30]MBR0565817.1 type II secretion system minor pseudopilin GspI [Azoarcus sp. L1K30]